MDHLLDLRLPRASCDATPSVVAQLCLQFAQLQADFATLRLENLELRQQAGYWKSCHQRARERIDKLRHELELVRGHNRQLQDQQFGTKTEKQSKADRSNTLEGFDEIEPDPDQPNKPRVVPKRRDFNHLPTKTEVVELPEDQRVCPQCGQPRQAMTDTEDSEQLEIEVRAYRRVIRRKRYRQTCSSPDCQTTTAPVPPKLLPKSLLGTSIWIEILLAKYRNHQPIERFLASWKLTGLDLAASTVNTGLERLQPLFEPVYEAIHDRNRASTYQQADETRWLVFTEIEGKMGYRWWLWVFLGEDTVVYVLDPRRSHAVPEDHFTAGISIILMVDRYAAYQAMEPVKNGLIVLAFCWAHVRRDFVRVGKSYPELKAWAIDWLELIREAYRCNRRRVTQLGTPEFAATDAKLREIVELMKSKAAEQLSDAKLRAACQTALESLQKHWVGLTRFVDDPRIPMDNNRSERELRGPALGRKNYYGSNSRWSGQLAVILFSIFATLSKWQINPRTWVKFYLDACASAGGTAPSDVREFLPWLMSEDRRKQLGEAIPFRPMSEELNSS